MVPRCYIFIGVLVLFSVMVNIKAAVEPEGEPLEDDLSSRKLRVLRASKIISGLFLESQPDCLPKATALCCNNTNVVKIVLCGVKYLVNNRDRCMNQPTNIVQIG